MVHTSYLFKNCECFKCGYQLVRDVGTIGEKSSGAMDAANNNEDSEST